MKFLISLFLIVVFNSSLFSQTGWQPVQSGVPDQLNTIYFVNNNTGYAAGSNGTYLKTTDAGANWSVTIFTIAYSFGNLFFFNANTGVMTSGYSHGIFSDGALWRTTNAGQDWVPHWINASIGSLYSIHFINHDIGYGVGRSAIPSGRGTIAKTTNGGVNWTLQLQLSYSSTFWSTYFINQNTGYACGSNSNFFKTTNGGSNWIQQNTGVENLAFIEMQFVNENTGFIIGSVSTNNATVLKTTNAGLEWSSKAIESSSWSMQFLDESTGYIAGLNGKIFKTTDIGENWITQETNQSNYLFSVSFTNKDYGFASGSGGTIIKTTTGGTTGIIYPVSGQIPEKFSLSQNYPNPFNPVTNIKFSIPSTQYTTLKVFDIAGREVATLVNEKLQAGSYEFTFDANELSSGVYFYQLRAGDFIQVRKMVLTK